MNGSRAAVGSPVSSGSLVLGWGNPGRKDDGIGPAFAAAITDLDLPRLTVQSDYQLLVENVVDVAKHQRVIFVDADRSCTEPFSLRRVEASDGGPGFTTHSVAPEAVLALSRDLFDSTPEAWLLGIRGYDFDEFGEGLSKPALANLSAALDFVRSAVELDDFHEVNPVSEPLRSGQPAESDHGRKQTPNPLR